MRNSRLQESQKQGEEPFKYSFLYKKKIKQSGEGTNKEKRGDKRDEKREFGGHSRELFPRNAGILK